jgi:hypothetical protein
MALVVRVEELVLKIGGVHEHAYAHLPMDVYAIGNVGFGFGPSERRQEQRRQDGDNGNHHQEFDQRESSGLTRAAMWPRGLWPLDNAGPSCFILYFPRGYCLVMRIRNPES